MLREPGARAPWGVADHRPRPPLAQLHYNPVGGPLAQLVRAEDSSVDGVARGEPRDENRVNSGKPKAASSHGNPEPSRGRIPGRCRDSAEGSKPLNHRHERPTPYPVMGGDEIVRGVRKLAQT